MAWPGKNLQKTVRYLKSHAAHALFDFNCYIASIFLYHGHRPGPFERPVPQRLPRL